MAARVKMEIVVDDDELKKILSAFDKVEVKVKKNQEAVKKSSRAWKNFAINLLTWRALFQGVLAEIERATQSVMKFVDAAGEQDRAVTQMEATLRATGNAAGITSQEIQETAAQLAQFTTFTDQAIIAAQGLLASYGNIRGDIFKEATEAALDFAAATGRSLQDAMIGVGKALTDPKSGMDLLREAGIKLTASQQDLLDQAVEANDLLAQQKVILEALSRFQGSAAAQALDYAGKVENLKKEFNELQEIIGENFITVLNAAGIALENFKAEDFKKDIDDIGESLRKSVEWWKLWAFYWKQMRGEADKANRRPTIRGTFGPGFGGAPSFAGHPQFKPTGPSITELEGKAARERNELREKDRIAAEKARRQEIEDYKRTMQAASDFISQQGEEFRQMETDYAPLLEAAEKLNETHMDANERLKQRRELLNDLEKRGLITMKVWLKGTQEAIKFWDEESGGAEKARDRLKDLKEQIENTKDARIAAIKEAGEKREEQLREQEFQAGFEDVTSMIRRMQTAAASRVTPEDEIKKNREAVERQTEVIKTTAEQQTDRLEAAFASRTGQFAIAAPGP